jgi:hypothetical protein
VLVIQVCVCPSIIHVLVDHVCIGASISQIFLFKSCGGVFTIQVSTIFGLVFGHTNESKLAL